MNASGVLGPLPASGANVSIGRAGESQCFRALANASVNISGSRAAATVLIGFQTGDNGALAIQPGGDSYHGARLTLGNAGATGTLSVAAGGGLTVNGTLTAGSISGTTTIDLNGQTISATNYTRNGPVTNQDRGVGGGIQGQSFSIAGGSYVVDGADVFTTAASVSTGATAANNVPLTLSGTLSVAGVGSSYTVNAPAGSALSSAS